MPILGTEPDPLDRGAVVVKGQVAIFGNQNGSVLSFIPIGVDLGATDVDDLDPDDEESLIWKLSATADLALSGIVPRAGENRGLWLYNESAFTITLTHQDTGSADTNRFSLPGGSDFDLEPGSGVLIAKEDDSSSSAWIVLSATGGGSGFGDISEDRILGRAVGAGTGPVQQLTPIQAATIVAAEVASLIPSISVVHSSGTLQRAELLGEVTAAQNSNTLAITRNTNFDWTGIHNFTTIEYQNAVSSSISSNTNNWNPTGLGSNPYLFVNVTGTPQVTGLAAQQDGHIVTIAATGNFTFAETDFLVFVNDSGSSTAANRFVLPHGRNFGIGLGYTATFIYRASRWHLIHATAPPFGDTVSGDVVLCKLGSAGPLKTSTVNSFYQSTRSSLLVHIDSSSIIWDLGTDTLRRAALGGDVTAAENSNTVTINNGAVTNAKRANMAQATISGRADFTGTGAPTDLSGQLAGEIIARNATSLLWNGAQTYNNTINTEDELNVNGPIIFSTRTLTSGSNLNNVAVGTDTVIKIDATANIDLTGFSGGVEGRFLVVINDGTGGDIDIRRARDSSSGNQIVFTPRGAADIITLGTRDVAAFLYVAAIGDNGNGFWYVLWHTGILS